MKRIVVLAKQVPDTANVGSNAMKEDGTVNRAALPAIFNPEDLNALEVALTIKDKTGAEVHVITMGPPAAVEILKTALYMGADRAALISDRRFAGSDTLATARVLAAAIRKIGGVDLIIAGKQAIDGDTGQVGPQVANLLDFNCISYVAGLEEVTNESMTVLRDGEVRLERIRTRYPALITVTHDANAPRYPSAHRMLRYFRAGLASEFPQDQLAAAERNDWIIPTWDMASLNVDEAGVGLKGSPTKVFSIKNIVLKGQDLEMYPAERQGISKLIKDIMKDYVEV